MQTDQLDTIMYATILAFLASGCSKTDTEKPPNIIIILADDLGYADLGCYGQENIETPHIDELAADGMKFTQHYAGSAVSAPSRCILLTGLHSGHAQIRGNDEMTDRGDVWNYKLASSDPSLEGQRPIKEGTQTIATLLFQEGYKTGIIGKWGLGGPLSEGIPNKQGFDFFLGYNCQRQAHTYFPMHLWKDTIKVALNNKLVPPHTQLPDNLDPYNPKSYSDFQLNEYSPELMQKKVIQFIKGSKNQPFFLYYATPIPHLPLQAPQRWIDYYINKFGDEQPYTGNLGYFPQKSPRACYAAMISYLDEQVGEIIAVLKGLNIYDNTLIIFSSDNGPAFNGGTDLRWFESAAPFRSEEGFIKASLSEGGIRIPMITCWKNKISSGTQTDLISAHYDILPTLCDILKLKPYGFIDGISFLPTLLKQNFQEKHSFLYWELPEAGGQQAVRMDKWKAIRKNIFKNNLKIQLYNLEEDIQELTDVSESYPEIVQQIEFIMEKEHIKSDILRFKFKALGD